MWKRVNTSFYLLSLALSVLVFSLELGAGVGVRALRDFVFCVDVALLLLLAASRKSSRFYVALLASC